MFKFIKSMMWFIKPNWWRYVIVVVLGLALNVLNLLPAYVTAMLTRALEQDTLTEEVLYKVLFYFLASVLGIYLVSTTKRQFQNRLTNAVYYALHKRYIDSIMVQDATFFEKYQAGDLLTRALGDINTVKFSGGNRLLNIFVESIGVVTTFVAMCLIDPLLALFAFIPLSGIFISNIFLRAKVKENWKQVRFKHSQMGNKVLESITNVRTVRAFSKEDEDYLENLKYSADAYETEVKNLKINVIFQPLFMIFVAVSTIITYSVGSYFYYIGRLTEIALLIQFIMYLNMFRAPLTMIGNMINNFYQSLISAERLNDVFNSKTNVLSGEEEIEEIEEIEFKNYHFTYPNDNFEVLNAVNIEIKDGNTIGIVGKTASGKSTAIRMLLRQLYNSEDEIYINGKKITDYDKSSIRKHISYVPQEHVLFTTTVYRNILIGNMNATENEVLDAIKLADLEKDIENLPQGMETIVGEYGVTLSGGQKQRISIARAFLRNSDVLILDDSLSAVDGKTESNIIDNLKKFRNKKTNIIIAHRLSAVMHADKIYVFDDGKIIESGSHQDLMKRGGWYYTQFISQQMEGGKKSE